MTACITHENSCTLHTYDNPKSGLFALVAIHSTKLGPALGGCRCLTYPNTKSAIEDVTRLAKSMSYKAAMAGISHGGGKAVLVRPAHIKDRKAYFEEFGEFVESLGGDYITSVDSGTNISDMDDVSHTTSYVCGTSKDGCTPSIYTAMGVLEGIKVAVRKKLQRNDMEGVRVVIQGIGNVGSALAVSLEKLGAVLSLSDVAPEALTACLDKLQSPGSVTVVDPDDAHKTPCEVFSPCGLGSVITPRAVLEMDCNIVAGSANNQLLSQNEGLRLHHKGILYAPDYVINAGGLIDVAQIAKHKTEQEIELKTKQIGKTLEQIFNCSIVEDRACHTISKEMAENILY